MPVLNCRYEYGSSQMQMRDTKEPSPTPSGPISLNKSWLCKAYLYIFKAYVCPLLSAGPQRLCVRSALSSVFRQGIMSAVRHGMR